MSFDYLLVDVDGSPIELEILIDGVVNHIFTTAQAWQILTLEIEQGFHQIQFRAVSPVQKTSIASYFAIDNVSFAQLQTSINKNEYIQKSASVNYDIPTQQSTVAPDETSIDLLPYFPLGNYQWKYDDSYENYLGERIQSNYSYTMFFVDNTHYKYSDITDECEYDANLSVRSDGIYFDDSSYTCTASNEFPEWGESNGSSTYLKNLIFPSALAIGGSIIKNVVDNYFDFYVFDGSPTTGSDAYAYTQKYTLQSKGTYTWQGKEYASIVIADITYSGDYTDTTINTYIEGVGLVESSYEPDYEGAQTYQDKLISFTDLGGNEAQASDNKKSGGSDFWLMLTALSLLIRKKQ